MDRSTLVTLSVENQHHRRKLEGYLLFEGHWQKNFRLPTSGELNYYIFNVKFVAHFLLVQDVTHLLHPDDGGLVGDGAVDDGVEDSGRAAVHRQVRSEILELDINYQFSFSFARCK